ncbi:MAG TPA: hypothetical protein VIK53_17110 [Verrucomicrobiae bacterium]
MIDLSRDLRVNFSIMATEFSTVFGLLKTITGTAKRLADTRQEVKVNEVAIQLGSIVLDLQAEMNVIQSDYQNVLRTRDDLEKKLIEQENWNKERARYQLKQVGSSLWGFGSPFVYALKPGQDAGEPNHWLCARCYNDNKKRILQPLPGDVWACPECGVTIRVFSGEVV